MINIAELITDPDFAQSYTVVRSVGGWVQGRFVKTEQSLLFTGPIIAANQKEVNMLPEGDRVAGMMVFYTTADNPFLMSRVEGEEGLSDQPIWRGDRYKLLQVYQYDDYGYQKAIGHRIGGA